MMFHPFGIDGHRVRIDAKRQQEVGDDAVARARLFAERVPRLRQEQRAIRPVFHKSQRLQPLHDLRRGRLRHAHMRGKIDQPRLAVTGGEVADQFGVILRHFRGVRLARGAKSGSAALCIMSHSPFCRVEAQNATLHVS